MRDFSTLDIPARSRDVSRAYTTRFVTRKRSPAKISTAMPQTQRIVHGLRPHNARQFDINAY
jgi:hypothetical protein